MFRRLCCGSDLRTYVSSLLDRKSHNPAPSHYTAVAKTTVDVSAKGMTSKAVADACEAKGINVRIIDDKTVGLNFGESITKSDVETLV